MAGTVELIKLAHLSNRRYTAGTLPILLRESPVISSASPLGEKSRMLPSFSACLEYSRVKEERHHSLQ